MPDITATTVPKKLFLTQISLDFLVNISIFSHSAVHQRDLRWLYGFWELGGKP